MYFPRTLTLVILTPFLPFFGTFSLSGLTLVQIWREGVRVKSRGPAKLRHMVLIPRPPGSRSGLTKFSFL